MSLTIEYYKGNAEEWDKFILEESMNGTFLQTRRFIDYHPEGRFTDCSICIRKGQELMAAVLACVTYEDGIKTFFAHKGTTFGGITISRKIYSASAMDEVFSLLESFLQAEGFGRAYFRMVSWVFQRQNTDLTDYFLFKYGYTCFNELNFYMNTDNYRDDIPSRLSSSTRRFYRHSLKNGLTFRKLGTQEEIASFYDVLQKNLKKFNASSVHTLEELYDLKFSRFNDRIEFYGVYSGEKIIAGSMVFLFGQDILHTQYLASDNDYLKLFPMDFLIVNLIREAVDRNMKTLTLGICTEDRGRYLNFGLSRFKEGFGTTFFINRSYEKLYANSVKQPIQESESALQLSTEHRAQSTEP